MGDHDLTPPSILLTHTATPITPEVPNELKFTSAHHTPHPQRSRSLPLSPDPITPRVPAELKFNTSLPSSHSLSTRSSLEPLHTLHYPTPPVLNSVSVTAKEMNTQTNFHNFSAITCLQLLPLLTNEQVRREYTYLMSCNPNYCPPNFDYKNAKQPNLTEQRYVIREALTDEVAIVHDILLNTATSKHENEPITPLFSCVLEKLQNQSRQLDDQMTALCSNIKEVTELKERLLSTSPAPVSNLNFDDIIDNVPCESILESSRSSSTPNPTSQNVLFITDSILNSFNPNIFKPRDRTCAMNITKLTLFKLHELKTDKFDNYDTVVISAGINDMCKYGYSPDSLFRFILNCLIKVNPKVRIIFRALTPTRFELLNEAIYAFNNEMFDLSLCATNIFYYDPYKFEDRRDFIYSHGNGIHLTNHVAVFMAMDILNHAQFLHTGKNGFEPWPLRPSLRTRYLDSSSY